MWIVRLTDQHTGRKVPCGPFDDRPSADRFRELRGEPAAEIEQLHDPITELLRRIDAPPARPSVRGGAQLGPGDEDGYRKEQGT